jgi:hypothetical protein
MVFEWRNPPGVYILPIFPYFNSHVYLVEYAGVTTFVDTSHTCYVSFHYSIYSKVNEADAWPAHII